MEVIALPSMDLLSRLQRSHIANTPAALQSAYCNSASDDSLNMEAFPCDASWPERVAHVLRHLHLGLSQETPVLVTQLLMLAGILVALADFLKIYPTHHPLLHGKPTTISSPLRQAIALGIRLGCPLQQIIATLVAWKLHSHYPDTAQRPGLRIYSLCKARTLFLGQTVNASFSCAVPCRVQRWAGAVEISLILVAMVLTARRPPYLQELLQLLVYAPVMYFVPLAVVQWQQSKEHMQAVLGSSRDRPGAALEPACMLPAGMSDVKAGTSKSHANAEGGSCSRTAPSPAGSSSIGISIMPTHSTTSSTPAHQTGPAGNQHRQKHEEELLGINGMGEPSKQKQQEAQVTAAGQRKPEHQTRPGPTSVSLAAKQVAAGAALASVSLPVKQVAAGAKGSTSFLYRSFLHHTAVSLKVYGTSRSYSEAAAALQQALPMHLVAALPDKLMHVSTACVRGCIHMFGWLSELRGPLVTDPAEMTALQDLSMRLVSAAGTGGSGGAQDNLPAVLTSSLLGAAATAGSVGHVDVQVTTQGPSHRYHLEAPATAEAPVAPSPVPPAPDAANIAAPNTLQLHSIQPPCLALPDMRLQGAHTPAQPPLTAELRLTTEVAQTVRVLLLTASTGAELVHAEHDTVAGGVTTISMPTPVEGLMTEAAHGLSSGAQHASHSPQPVIPLHVVITTPANHADQTNPPQLAHVYATATLLAAPVLLASELCTAHEFMQQQGRAQGLNDQEIWSHYWQPLMQDVCLLATSALPKDEDPIQQANAAVVAQAAHTLSHFFDINSMHAWQAQAVHVLSNLFQQQAEAPQPSLPAAQVPTAGDEAGEEVPSTATSHDNADPPALPDLTANLAARASSGRQSRKPKLSSSYAHLQQPSLTSSASGSSNGQEGASAAAGKGASDTATYPSGPSSSRAGKRPAPMAAAQAPSTPTSRPLSANTKALMAWLRQGLQLLHRGFPDAAAEKEWQEGVVLTYSPFFLVLQAGIFAASVTRTWQAGLLVHWSDATQLIFYTAHAAVWMLATVRCMHSRSRRARARVLLLASIASAALLALTWLGLLNEGGTFGRLSTSTWAVTFVVMLRVLQLQGTLWQWAPVGGFLSLMWFFPRLAQGVPLAPALASTLTTWGLSCCLAAGLEVWQRNSYLQLKAQQHSGCAGSAESRHVAAASMSARQAGSRAKVAK